MKLHHATQGAGITLLALSYGMAGCASASSAKPSTHAKPAIVKSIEKAHNAADWRANQAVQADIVVNFGGRAALQGVVTFSTDASRARIVRPDGSTVVFDGNTAWVAGGEFPRARFHVLTWPYFAAVPYKLADAGTQLTEQPPAPFNSATDLQPAWKLTFGPGTGDAPNDWYLLFPDPATGRLTAMAYIVTFDKTLAEAEKDPHAIRYLDFRPVGGVPIPHRWTFHDYSHTTGISAAQIGDAVLSNVRFITPDANTFTAPAGAIEAPLSPTP